MIRCRLKLKLRPAQERQLDRWLWHLTAVYNWALLKIEHDAADGIYHTRYDLFGLLVGHSRRLGVSAKTLEGTVSTAHTAWQRCFKGLARRPRLKGRRNRLNSIPSRLFGFDARRLRLDGLGALKFHQQEIPVGRVISVRVLKRASGWYCSLVIDAEPNAIPIVSADEIGIDPGFSSLLTLSNGEVVAHPRELEASAIRVAQAQRGRRTKLTARLQERIGRQRLDRNHKLSRRLVSENKLIAFSADQHRNIARTFGKSVSSSSHFQLRQMLAYKCLSGGRQYVEVSARNSTRACSACRELTGPRGWRGLSVRQWVCPTCGVEHDRDVNAAINTLRAGRGVRLKDAGDSVSGIVTEASRRNSTGGLPVNFAIAPDPGGSR